MLFISHDLALVRYLADEVVVMYLGRVIECGPVRAVQPAVSPIHRGAAVGRPLPDPSAGRARIRLEGEIPSPLDSATSDAALPGDARARWARSAIPVPPPAREAGMGT